MSGNTSKTYILDTEGMKTFIKKAPVDKFDTRTLAFQSNLRQYIQGTFNINQYDNIKVVTGDAGTDMFYEIAFQHLDEQPWAPNKDNMKIIGKSMAFIHNHCFRNKTQITLNVKKESYDRMESWMLLSDDIPFKKKAQKIRQSIFNDIPRLNTAQPKIPLHRDFKPHNILFDGTNYHLIDFDFAAVDYVGLEVMGFIVDIIESGLGNVQAFLDSYLTHCEIPGIQEAAKLFVTDYLNYLCTNTFPFYLHGSLEPKNFKNLVKHRNNSLETLYSYSDRIRKMIEEIQYENI